jgi:hypothetical protein
VILETNYILFFLLTENFSTVAASLDKGASDKPLVTERRVLQSHLGTPTFFLTVVSQEH